MTQIMPPVTVAVTPIEVSTPLTPHIVTGLAREVAIGLRETEEILATYKVSTAAYETLKKTDLFQKLVDAARIEWNSALNTVNRTQLEAAALVESILPKIFARMNDSKEALNHVVEAGKWLSDVGGLKKVPGHGDPGERFTIEINLGADTKLTFDQSRAPLAGDPVTLALPEPRIDPEERV